MGFVQGSNTLAAGKIKLGSTDVDKIYFGSTEAWPDSQPPIVEDGRYQILGGYTGNIFVSNNNGNSFIPAAYSSDWFSIGISGTGQYLLAGTFSSSILQRSEDYGVTWNPTPYTASQTRTISISNSGQYQVYIADGIGTNKVRISNDFGVTFLNGGLAITQSVFDSAISATGQYISFVTATGPIYSSSDFGATWQTRANSRFWTAITMTSTGEVQLATGPTSNVWVSTDFGLTWIEKLSTSNNNAGIVISSDGTVAYKIGNTGRIIKSTDLFTTSTNLTVTGIYFVSIDTSSNGQYILASYNGNGASGYYISNDFGSTFTISSTSTDVSPVAVNRLVI
jgi:photosystem II stability/assembly factor-like uncharacterized protein